MLAVMFVANCRFWIRIGVFESAFSFFAMPPKAKKAGKKGRGKGGVQGLLEFPAAQPGAVDPTADDSLDDVSSAVEALACDSVVDASPAVDALVPASKKRARKADGQGASSSSSGAGLDVAQAKRFIGYANYHAGTQPNLAATLAEYRDGTSAQKLEILQKFAKDKSCAWKNEIVEEDGSEGSLKTGAISGKMTEWEIAALNHLLPTMPNYRVLLDALLQDLPSEEHPLDAWQPFTRLYEYEHKKHRDVTSAEVWKSYTSCKVDCTKAKVGTQVKVKEEMTDFVLLQRQLKASKTAEKKHHHLLSEAKQTLAGLRAYGKIKDIDIQALRTGIGIFSEMTDELMVVIKQAQWCTETTDDKEISQALKTLVEASVKGSEHLSAFMALASRTADLMGVGPTST